MNQLFDKQGNPVPPRPDFTEEIMREGALKAIKSGHLSLSLDESEYDDFADNVAGNYYDGIDAYDMAKRMDHDGYDVDRDFVEDMEQVDFYIREANREAEKVWFETYKPEPPFEIGTELQFHSFFGGANHGVIDGIYESAKYLVKVAGTADGDTTRRIIKFEDAKLRVIE